MSTVVTVVAFTALLVALAALATAVVALRQSAAVASILARHRHGHVLRDGTADPGAARSARTGGRREAPSYGPPTTEASAVTPEQVAADAAQTAHLERQRRLPRPGEIGGPRA